MKDKGYVQLKKIAIAILMMIGVVKVCSLLNYMYVRPDDWGRVFWHNYYKTDHIDNIFVGASHVYCSVDPYLLDEINGMDNYNIASPNMRLNGAYYAIKEVTAQHDIKNIYVELCYQPSTGAQGDILSKESYTNNWRISDFLKMSPNKLSFIMTMSRPDKYLDTIFPFIRYREHIFDSDYVNATIGIKTSEDYRQYRYRQEDGLGITEYQDKGYYYTDIKLSDRTLMASNEWNLKPEGLMPDNTQTYLRKIIEYCQGRDINLVLFVVPMYEVRVGDALNYDRYFQQILTIASEYGVPLYDFNLCKSEYLDIMHTALFMDMGHLNKSGADLFTPFLWDVLSHDPEENQQYFCSTYAEKISLDAPKTYGVVYRMGENNVRRCTIVSNREKELEYSITITLPDGEQRIIQDFSANKEFALPIDLCGTMSIMTRIMDQPDSMQILEFSF